VRSLLNEVRQIQCAANVVQFPYLVGIVRTKHTSLPTVYASALTAWRRPR